MDELKPLPEYLQTRYHGWKATKYAESASWYRRLASDGQRPRAMVIACCDSRVNTTEIFGAEHGEFFVHRNIANLVPPYAPDEAYHGTSAAVEYAVTVLEVSHLIVMGHSQCGGVKGCLEMCKGNAPDLEKPDSFVGSWLQMLKPKFDKVKDLSEGQEQEAAFERQAALTSVENLMTFPFVSERVRDGRLNLHALRFDISDGGLEAYQPVHGAFQPV
jgi:carbonic anhydrase